MNLPISFILSLVINPKSIFTIWRKKVLRHSFSRQDTHTTNFHRFLSGWIGPFDRILPIFLFTQMHNGPCWNKNFAHKECWLYLYTLTKILRWDISFLKFSFVGLEFLKNFFFCTFFGRKKNFLPWWDSPLSQLPEEFLHLDILPHLTQITPKRSLKIAIRSHAATQLVCAIAKYRNALGRFIRCTQQAEIRQKLYVQFLRSQTVCYNNGGFWGGLAISCWTMHMHTCIASFLHCFAQCAIIQ